MPATWVQKGQFRPWKNTFLLPIHLLYGGGDLHGDKSDGALITSKAHPSDTQHAKCPMLRSLSCSSDGSQAYFSQAPDCGVKLSLTPLSPISNLVCLGVPVGSYNPLPISCHSHTLLPEIHSLPLSFCFHPIFLQPCFQHNAHCSAIPGSTLSHQIQRAPPGIQALAAMSALPHSISSPVTPLQPSFPYLTLLTPVLP